MDTICIANGSRVSKVPWAAAAAWWTISVHDYSRSSILAVEDVQIYIGSLLRKIDAKHHLARS